MSIRISCDACGRQGRVPDKLAGKRIRCPECAQVVQVSAAGATEPAGAVEDSKSAASRSNSKRPQRRSARRMGARPAPPPPPRLDSPQPEDSSADLPQADKRRAFLVPLGIGAVVLFIGLVGFLAYRLGQSSESQTPDRPGAELTAADSSADSAPGDSEAAWPADSELNVALAGVNAVDSALPDSNQDAQLGFNFDSTETPRGPDPSVPKVNPSADTPGPHDGAADVQPLPPVVAPPKATVAPQPEPAQPQPVPVKTLPELIAMIEPAVVLINVRTADGQSTGSGFIVDDVGTVVTNYHVIEGGQTASVMLSDKQKVPVLGVTYVDPQRDIAILRIDSRGLQLPALKLMEKLPLKGEGVVALGAPFGLDSTASEGIVSSIRSAEELEVTVGISGHAGTWIQTTAPISPGNSGGPLVNRKGEVVAINTLSLKRGQNLNFGISAIDIGRAVRSQSDPKNISPVVAPPRMVEGQGNVIDIVGTAEADKFLGRIKQMRVVILAFSADPRRVVINSVKTEAVKALQSNNVFPAGEEAEAMMVIRMSLTDTGGSGAARGAQQLKVTTSIHYRDETQAATKVYKIWESNDRLGTLSLQSLLNGILPRRLGSDVREHFAQLGSAFKKAKQAAKP